MEKKKCSTCHGFGVWAVGFPVPMTREDSRDMPTKECPECGAGK